MSQRLLVWLLTLVAALLPTYLLRFQIFGVPTTMLELLVLLTIAVAIIQLIYSHKTTNYKLQTTNSLWLLSVCLFVLAGTISVLVAPETRAALGLWKAYIIEPIAIFLIAAYTLRTDRERRSVVIGLVLSGLFVTAVGLWQKFSPDGIAGLWGIYRSASNMEWYTEATRRITSVYPFPNAIGLFLAPIAVLLRGLLLHNVRRFTDGRRRVDRHQLLVFLLLSATSALMALAIFWAGSHGALVGLVAGATVIGLLSEHRRLTLQIITLALAFFLLVAPFRTLVIEEFGGHENSVPIRTMEYRETWQCLRQTPRTFWLGGGLSGYKTLVAACHKSKAIEIYQYPHNILLNFWSEMGLVGVVSFVAIVLLFYQRGLQFIFSTRRKRKLEADLFHPNPIALPMALLGAMTALLVHGLVDVPYFKNDLAILFWLLVAIMITSTQPPSTRPAP